MSRRFVTLAALLAALHSVASIASLFLCLSQRMAQFDDPTLIETTADRLTCRVADILFQPAMTLWGATNINGAASFVQWIVVLLNSLLWGIVLAVAIEWFSRRFSRRQ